MSKDWRTGLSCFLMLAGALCISGCSAVPSTSSTPTNTSPASVAYINGPSSTGMVGYSTVPANNGSSVAALAVSAGGPLATDPSAQIYVASSSDSPAAQILVFPANSSGSATPSRTINLDGVNRLAVDPVGRTYVLNLGANFGPPTVDVYSAAASGTATPIRSLQLTNVESPVEDIAADAAGNLYVAGYYANGWAIAVYPPTASGPSLPARTIDFGNSTVYGVAVDPKGDVYVNTCAGCYDGANAIEEFAPGASGSAAPTNTINLTVASAWTIVNGGPVRLDGAGNIFTSLQLMSNATMIDSIVVYGFGPTATGGATPTVQIAPTNNGYNTFLAVN
jgi:hypothetical protein